MGSGLRPWGDGRSPHPGTLAAALEFIHTNNCSNPISMRVCGLLRAAVYSSKKHRSRVASKATSRHAFGPCNFSCVVCDLMAWGSGGFPRAGRADGTT
jgi:hypothetical protein